MKAIIDFIIRHSFVFSAIAFLSNLALLSPLAHHLGETIGNIAVLLILLLASALALTGIDELTRFKDFQEWAQDSFDSLGRFLLCHLQSQFHGPLNYDPKDQSNNL